jgi:hypothetical protein
MQHLAVERSHRLSSRRPYSQPAQRTYRHRASARVGSRARHLVKYPRLRPSSRRRTAGTDTRLAARSAAELALVEASGRREWPPRLPEQPIFYPVLNEEYAATIARDWNVQHSGAGYGTRFKVLRSFLDQYEVHQVGGKTILEYWIPADDLPALNASIVGTIEVTAEFR